MIYVETKMRQLPTRCVQCDYHDALGKSEILCTANGWPKYLKGCLPALERDKDCPLREGEMNDVERE